MSTSEIFPRVKLDDALIERIKTVLGDDDGDAFAWLWAEYLHLRMCFNDLKMGFGGDDPPMIHLWAVSPEFENRYRNLLVEAIVLAACRLTDNDTVSCQKRISISVLPEWFAHEPNLKNEMKRLVKIASDPKALRTWRNRHLAHTADKRERTRVSGNEVEAAVDALHAALAFVWRERFKEEPEAPQPRPASGALGEHLSRMHDRAVKFAAWLLDAAGHDAGDDIHDAAAAVRRLAAGSEAEAADPGNESDPVVEFLEGAREARKVMNRIGDLEDSDRYKVFNFIGVAACNSIPRETHRGPARVPPSAPWSP